MSDETGVNKATVMRRWTSLPSSHLTSFAAGFLLAVAMGAWLGLGMGSLKADTSPYPTSAVFLGNRTIIGQTIAYPAGTPMVNAVIVPLAPGGKSAWHTHKTPVFGFVLEGELTIDYGSKGTRVYRAGEAVLEAIDWPHQASNRGNVLTRVLAVNIGVDGGAFADPATGPQ